MTLEYNEFKAWLETKEPEEIVGRPGDPCGCPIAQYFLENGHSYVHVDGVEYTFDIKAERSDDYLAPNWEQTPDWAGDLIMYVDNANWGPTIDAAAVLGILSAIHAA